jgi:hypothetical protein
MSQTFLPRQDSPIHDTSGRATTPYYTWFQSLSRLQGLTDEQAALIQRALDAIAALPKDPALPASTQLLAINSLQAIGSLQQGVMQIQLQNDQPAPPAFWVYGTDADGSRGWGSVIDFIATGVGLKKAVDYSPFNFLGTLNYVTNLPVSGSVDDAYLIALDADDNELNDLYVWSGTEWLNSGPPSGRPVLSLAELPDSGAGTLRGITRDAYGRISGTTNATITGTAGQIVVANGNAAAGPPTLSLADVADAGGGTLQRTAFDAKGRKTGTSTATTSDLAEGSNLYFTDARAQNAVVAAAIANGDTTHAPSGDAVFDALALLTPISTISKVITAYGSGSSYPVTDTYAAVVMGTTSPSITIDSPGTYLIRGYVRLHQDAVTHAAPGRDFFATVRRTNNTAADIPSANIAWGLRPEATAVSETVGMMQLPEVVYTTTNSDDVLTLFVKVSALPTTGVFSISGAQIIAHRLSA